VVDPTMVALLEEALTRADPADDRVRARLMTRLGAALVPPQSVDVIPRVLSLAQEGIAIARRTGDPETLLYSLRFGAAGEGYLVGENERRALAEEIVLLARARNNRTIQLDVSGWYAVTLLQQGRRAEADAVVEEYARLIGELTLPIYRWRLPAMRALF